MVSNAAGVIVIAVSQEPYKRGLPTTTGGPCEFYSECLMSPHYHNIMAPIRKGVTDNRN